MEYYDISNEYSLYCYQSSSEIYISILNENFKIKSQYAKNIYNSAKSCSQYFFSSLVYHASDVTIFTICDNILNEHFTLKEFLNSTTSSLKKINDKIDENELIIIQKINNKTKEEIIDNLGEVIDECALGKIYEIFGNDYEIKISPINIKKYKNISTYIEFLSCEEKLRNYYHISKNTILTVFQIEINKKNDKSLTNQVEYTVFDAKKNRLDLSICSNELITIYYSIKNFSDLSLSSISKYADIGVDIFNISAEFFNDICYPYSENDSDIILRDRVSDIYQNFSLCDLNCEYENIDIVNMTISCNCLVKTEIETEIEEPKFDQIIFDIFQNSTIGVIKCYNLVFNLNIKNNIGFWIFLIFIIIHIPFIINYLVNGDKEIKKYIKIQLDKLKNLLHISNPKKKIIIKTLNNKQKVNFNLYNIFNLNNNKKNKRKKGKTTTNELLCDNSSSIKKINNKIKDVFRTKIKKSNTMFLKNNNKKKNKNITKKMSSKSNNEKNIIIHNKNKKKNKNKLSINKTIIYEKNNKSCLSNHTINIKKDTIFQNNLYYDIYEEAIKYENRNLCIIFLIIFVVKEKLINTFCFKSPLELKSLHICLLIFIYSCNFSFNTLFYFSGNISDKYHYNGNSLYLFTLVNNLSICFISTLLCSVIVMFLRYLISSRKVIENTFRQEEVILKKMNIKFNKEQRKKIFLKLIKILSKLRIKFFLFIIIEFIILLFFLYFTTAFCEVYKSTQISWIIDCIVSFLISIIIEIIISILIAVLYKLSITKKIKCLYNILLLLI